MVGTGNRFSQTLGNLDGLYLQHKGLFQMDHIGPADGFLNDVLLAGSEMVTVSIDNGLKNGEIKIGKQEFRLRAVWIRVGT